MAKADTMNQTRTFPPGAAPETSPAGPPMLRSTDLLAGAREVLIRHGEDTYRLKLTGNNKLILTK